MKNRYVLAGLVLLIVAASPASAQTLRVLLTNDDGVAAPGLDALVTQLVLNPNLDLTVIAPAANSSGTGDNRTFTSIVVTTSMTASGYPAEAVTGFPADTVLFGILEELQANPPDLVVSGINLGQNLSAEIVPISGTVGAAYWAARLGFPAIAVSASLVAPNYADAAVFVAKIVEKFRKSNGFKKKMKENGVPFRGLVLNVNYPTCTVGSAVRGARVVGVGRLNNFTGYTMTGPNTWQPTVVSANFFLSDCTSTLAQPTTDIEAWNNGFATISPLTAERSVAGRKLRQFGFVERLF
jgi:5'-nucleotidase